MARYKCPQCGGSNTYGGDPYPCDHCGYDGRFTSVTVKPSIHQLTARARIHAEHTDTSSRSALTSLITAFEAHLDECPGHLAMCDHTEQEVAS